MWYFWGHWTGHVFFFKKNCFEHLQSFSNTNCSTRAPAQISLASAILHSSLYPNRVPIRVMGPQRPEIHQGHWITNCWCNRREEVKIFSFSSHINGSPKRKRRQYSWNSSRREETGWDILFVISCFMFYI